MAGPFTYSGTRNGVNAVFTIAQVVSVSDVYVAGLHLNPTGDYTATSTTTTTTLTITNSAAIPQANDDLLIYGTPGFGVTAATTSTVGFLTAGSIINRAAVQCGLASVADPYAVSDPNFVQLCELLNMVGGDLLSAHEWGHFVREATISTANSATSYALPSDYDRFIDQTGWNRSTRFSMIGPLSGQEVQYLKARLSGVLIQVGYRLQGNLITFAIAPSDSQTLAFEYISNYWVQHASAPDATTAVATGDYVLYDSDLSIAALRLAFLDAKGFDTNSARERYESKLEHAIAKNVGSKMLNMGGIGINADHLIDAANLPITGYAS